MIGGVTRSAGLPGLPPGNYLRQFCHENVSKWGDPPTRGRSRVTSDSRQILWGGG